MSKYSYEFKKKVVLEYLAGEGGPVILARKYGTPSETPPIIVFDNKIIHLTPSQYRKH